MKKIIFFLFLLLIFIFYRGPNEKVVRGFEGKGNWVACDQTFQNKRVLAAKIMDRLNPLLVWNSAQLLASREKNFDFLILPNNSKVYGGKTDWNDFFEDLIDFKFYLHRDHWEYLKISFEYLLSWDNNRLVKNSLVGRKNQKHFFDQSSAVVRFDKNNYVILLDIGDFAGFENIFSKIIEFSWAVSPHRLHVAWVKNDPRAFRLTYRPTGRAHEVISKERRIYLLPKVRAGTIAHEIGHVIGFADHYEDSFRYSDCSISSSSYHRDIMANSNFGHALEGHWKIIESVYSKKSRNIVRYTYRPLDVFKEKEEQLTYLYKISKPSRN